MQNEQILEIFEVKLVLRVVLQHPTMFQQRLPQLSSGVEHHGADLIRSCYLFLV